MDNKKTFGGQIMDAVKLEILGLDDDKEKILIKITHQDDSKIERGRFRWSTEGVSFCSSAMPEVSVYRDGRINFYLRGTSRIDDPLSICVDRVVFGRIVCAVNDLNKALADESLGSVEYNDTVRFTTLDTDLYAPPRYTINGNTTTLTGWEFEPEYVGVARARRILRTDRS